jgi:hypothetical protein
VHDAEHDFAGNDGGADHRAHADVLCTSFAAEALVGHDVGAQYARVRIKDVVDYGLRGDDCVRVAVSADRPVAEADDLWGQSPGLGAAQQEDAAVDRHFLEDDVHDAGQQAIQWQEVAGDVGQLADNLPGLDRVGGFGGGKHKAIVT